MPVRTDAVHVVFTTPEETLAAVHVASEFARALHAPLTLVHFRAVPFPMSVDAPVGLSPTECDAFVDRLRREGVEIRVRVFLCRDAERVAPSGFRRHSFIVLGGRRRWWPTTAWRLRRQLEAAGHCVVFVDVPAQQEASCA